MHHAMPVPKLHPHLNALGVIRDQATLWLLSGIVFTTSGVFIGLALRGRTSSFSSTKGPAHVQMSPFENVGFTATVANSLFALIHLYCSTVPVLRDHATGLLEIRHVYFFAAVLTGFACCIGSAAMFLFNWQVSLLLGYTSATCGAVAAGQLAGAINPGVVVCRGGGVHTGGSGGVPSGVGHHYSGPPCGRGKKGGRCVCGGTYTTTTTESAQGGSGSGNGRSITDTDGTGTDHPQLHRPRHHLPDIRSHVETIHCRINNNDTDKDKDKEKESNGGTHSAEALTPVQSHTGTVKQNKPMKTTPAHSLMAESCYGDICPGRLGSNGAAAAVDMQMGLTGVCIV